mmetsp:Transcript_37263/g.117165  ORF Transcript_37263/g.117165 Transcript_37263/m.117165 type:complete len:161 (+) Transcript_37263:820-1302(+)
MFTSPNQHSRDTYSAVCRCIPLYSLYSDPLSSCASLTLHNTAFTPSCQRIHTTQARLAADEQPAALRAAADARQRAEDGPVGSAAEALREAYGSFALGAARVLRGDRLPSGYCPTAKRKAPKETGARWFASCECALFLWAGITGFLLEAPGSRRTWCSGL